MAISVIKQLYDNVIGKLSTISDLKYIIQYQTQDENQEDTSLYSYPAALVEIDVVDITQYIRRSDYNCEINIHLLVKEMNHDMYGSIEMTNKIYNALQGQHFTQSCSPIYYTDLTIDKKPENFSKTILKFNTIVTYRDNLSPYNGLTHSIENIIATFSYIGATESRGIHLTQSQI